MDTLLDKVMQLIAVKRGASHATTPDPTRRLRQTIADLLQTEAQLAQIRAQLDRVHQAVSTHEQQARALDAAIDRALQAGNERRAAAGQQALNQLNQQIRGARTQSRRLAAQAEQLQRALDRLEVKLKLRGITRQTLDEALRRAQSGPNRARSTAGSSETWRVVDPE